jgi:hypothetical protein
MTDPSIAYSRAQREAHATQHLLTMSALGWLNQTSCTRIAETYGVTDLIGDLKRLKGSLFPEFLSNGESR